MSVNTPFRAFTPQLVENRVGFSSKITSRAGNDYDRMEMVVFKWRICRRIGFSDRNVKPLLWITDIEIRKVNVLPVYCHYKFLCVKKWSKLAIFFRSIRTNR